MKIRENLWNPMKINENVWKSMKSTQNLWKSIKKNENLWKSMNMFEIYLFRKRRWVIFYILRRWTPHISVLQREINCLNRENTNWWFRENLDFDLQITCRSDIFRGNLKWSHSHYGHSAPDGFHWNPDRSEVFHKKCRFVIFQQKMFFPKI